MNGRKIFLRLGCFGRFKAANCSSICSAFVTVKSCVGDMGREVIVFRIGCEEGALRAASEKRHVVSVTKAVLECCECGSSVASEVTWTRLRPLSSTDSPDSSRSASHSEPEDAAISLDADLRECRVTHNRRSQSKPINAMTYISMHK